MKKLFLLTFFSLSIFIPTTAQAKEKVDYDGLEVFEETKKIIDKCDFKLEDKAYSDMELGKTTKTKNECLKQKIYEQLEIIKVEEPRKTEIIELLKSDKIYDLYDSIINYNEDCLAMGRDIYGCGTINKYLLNVGNYHYFLVSILDLIIEQKHDD